MQEDYNADYHDNLEVSLSSFVAREGLRGAEVYENTEYPVGIFHAGKELVFNATTTLAKAETRTIADIIKERITETLDNELSNNEIFYLWHDLIFAEEFMRQNYWKERYQDSISCAQRLIDDSTLLQKCDREADKGIMKLQIEWAKIFKEKAHGAWENPATRGLRMVMDYSQQVGDKETAKTVKEEIINYEPPKEGY